MSHWWWGKDSWKSFHYGLEDMDIIGDGYFALGVPDKFDKSFKKMIFAAAKAHTMHYASIDYCLKRYGDAWQFDDNQDKAYKLISEVSASIKGNVIDFLNYLTSIENKPDKPNLVACTCAMVRLQNTFRASIITIKSGLHFESAGLERMILEQLAWIYAIHDIDMNESDHFDIKPSKCITRLKDIFPFSGKFYGLLSAVSHLEPKETLRYLYVKDDSLTMELTSLDYSRVDVFHLLLLADMLMILGEYIYRDLIKEYRYIAKEENHRFIPKQNRPMAELIRLYEERLFEEKSSKALHLKDNNGSGSDLRIEFSRRGSSQARK